MPKPTVDPEAPDTKNSISADQTLLLQLAATIYTKPSMTSLQDAYQTAKNLVSMMLADPDAPVTEA